MRDSNWVAYKPHQIGFELTTEQNYYRWRK